MSEKDDFEATIKGVYDHAFRNVTSQQMAAAMIGLGAITVLVENGEVVGRYIEPWERGDEFGSPK